MNIRYIEARAWFSDLINSGDAELIARARALLEPTSIMPPGPETLRARMGRIIIGIQLQAFWWIIRAFRLRDEEIFALAHLMVRIRRKTEDDHRRLTSEVAELREKVSALERRSRDAETAQ
jgi:hypothetical protein